jgi:hypothetical protein
MIMPASPPYRRLGLTAVRFGRLVDQRQRARQDATRS